MSENLVVGGEIITPKAAMNLIAMIEKDAKEFAGVFYDMTRSAKFRINWPVQDIFVESEWRNFVQAVRAMYSERLGSEKTPRDIARKMYLAMLLERAYSEGLKAQGAEADTRLQLAPGTQQFEGDKYENRQIVEKFGLAPNLRARLRASTAHFKKALN
jgi:hypothetical protein